MQRTSVAKVTGLQSRTDLNGQLVLVGEQNAVSGRFAVEVIASGEEVLVKPCNLAAQDPIKDLYRGTVGQIDECHVLLQQLVRKVKAKSKTTLQWGGDQPFIDVILAKPFNHAFLPLEMNAIGHHCILDIYKTSKGLSARMLQSWVKDEVSNETQVIQIGFTAKEWLARPGYTWMNDKQFRQFLSRLEELRREVTNLTETELLACAKENGMHSLENQRQWAASVYRYIETEGLTLMPGLPDLAEAHKRDMINSGFPEEAELMQVYAGLSIGRPREIMTFNLDTGVKIMKLAKELFHEDLCAVSFVKALEFYKSDLGWKASLLQLS